MVEKICKGSFDISLFLLIFLILCECPIDGRKAGRRGRGRTRKVVQMFGLMGLKRKEFMNNTDVSIILVLLLDLSFTLKRKSCK